MQAAKVLILNSDPACVLASVLARMLESSSCADFKIEREILEFEDCEDCRESLYHHIDNSNPNLCLLVVTASLLPERAVETLQYLKDKVPEMPILAVLEDSVSDQAFKFLDCGAADFVIAPLKEIGMQSPLIIALKA